MLLLLENRATHREMISFLQSDTEIKDLIIPDSVQKAKFTEVVQKISKFDEIDYHQLLNNFLEESVWVLIKIALAFAIYCVGRLLMSWILRVMDRAFDRHDVEVSLRSFLRSIVKVLMLVMIFLAIVQTLGVNTSSFLAIFASAGLAIGMALSGTLQNFAGGVVLLLLRPYKVGDYIEAMGQSGTVESIGLFSTCLKTPDLQTIYVPNGSISTSIIDNYSQSETRRVDWLLSISYGDDVDVARREILAILNSDERVLKEPEAVVYVKTLNSSSVDLSIRAWTQNDDYWALLYDINERLYKELPNKGINFPFPQMDIHVKQN